MLWQPEQGKLLTKSYSTDRKTGSFSPVPSSVLRDLVRFIPLHSEACRFLDVALSWKNQSKYTFESLMKTAASQQGVWRSAHSLHIWVMESHLELRKHLLLPKYHSHFTRCISLSKPHTHRSSWTDFFSVLHNNLINYLIIIFYADMIAIVCITCLTTPLYSSLCMYV